MTRPLSLSEFSPNTGRRIPIGPHGDVDERFSAAIQEAVEAHAKADKDKAPRRGSGDSSSNGKNDPATPIPMQPHDASVATSRTSGGILTPFSAARSNNQLLKDFANFTPSASDTTGSSQDQSGGASRPAGHGLSGQSAIGPFVRDPSWTPLTSSRNMPLARIPLANEPNNTATENKPTPSDQQSAGVGKVPRFGVYGQGALSLIHDTNPRNPFRLPISGARPDGSALVEGTAGVSARFTPKLSGTADVKFLTKGSLREQRAEYSTVAAGVQATRKSGPTELTGRYEYLVVYDGTFKQNNFVAHSLSGSLTRQLAKSTASSANWEPRLALSATAGRRFGNVPAQEFVWFRPKISLKLARLGFEFEAERRDFTQLARVDTFVIGRTGVTFDYGKAKKDSFTIGVELRRQTLPGQTYVNTGIFGRFEFGRREKRF